MSSEISPQQAAQNDQLYKVDVRQAFEYQFVHAQGAVNMPLDKLDPAVIKEQAGDRQIALLCQGGDRARQAASKLSQAGVDNHVVITGGTAAWQAASLPVNQSAKPGMSVDRQMRMIAGSLVLTGALLAQFAHPGFIWLSGGVGFGLFMAGVTGVCPMIGFLGLMPWNKTSCEKGASCCSA